MFVFFSKNQYLNVFLFCFNTKVGRFFNMIKYAELINMWLIFFLAAGVSILLLQLWPWTRSVSSVKAREAKVFTREHKEQWQWRCYQSGPTDETARRRRGRLASGQACLRKESRGAKKKEECLQRKWKGREGITFKWQIGIWLPELGRKWQRLMDFCAGCD